MEPFIGQIQAFGFNFPPRGWAQCDGQLLSISQNQALFSLLGTMYGGDGRTTFGLPDLRGRVMIHQGNGPGLSSKSIGQKGGSETNTLSVAQLPSHNHNLRASSTAGDSNSPTGRVLGDAGFLDNDFKAAESLVDMNVNAIGNTGGSQPVNNMQPYQVINICIALTGIYPSRN